MIALFDRATVNENLEGIVGGCPMTDKWAKVMSMCDAFENSHPKAFHRFVEFFQYNNESLPPLHTEALCKYHVIEAKIQNGIVRTIRVENTTRLDPQEVASDQAKTFCTEPLKHVAGKRKHATTSSE